MKDWKLVLLGVVALVLGVIGGPVITNLGSVAVSNEYTATTTKIHTGVAMNNGQLLTSDTATARPCVLGSVVITGAAAGAIAFYDATTSNVNLRDAAQASSTILLAAFPPSAAANTYTFDVACKRGILVELGAVVPTTTVTWR